MDVLDTEFIWCKGLILKVNTKKNGLKMLLVHYKGWNKVYDELIESTSKRLAPEGFFTNRLGIVCINRNSEICTRRRSAECQRQLRDSRGRPQQPAGQALNPDSDEETRAK